MIPESAVITEKSIDARTQEFRDHLAIYRVKLSGCNVGGADIRTRTASSSPMPDSLRRTLVRRDALYYRRGPAHRASRAPYDRRSPTPAWRDGSRMRSDVALETHKGPTQNAEAMLSLMSEVDHPTSVSISIQETSPIIIKASTRVTSSNGSSTWCEMST